MPIMRAKGIAAVRMTKLPRPESEKNFVRVARLQKSRHASEVVDRCWTVFTLLLVLKPEFLQAYDVIPSVLS
jgi:hypothetical protein